MLMQACMICNKSERVFNIFYDNNGNNKYSVKDDMIEFFGEQVEQFLSENDVICNTCMNILDSVATLKRRLWPVVCSHLNKFRDIKPIKLGKIWDKFATYLHSDLDNESISSRTSTPHLLTPKYAVPYDESRPGTSLSGYSFSSNLSMRSGTPFADWEIQNVFKKKNKQRKSKSRKRSQRTRSLSYGRKKTKQRKRNYDSSPGRPASVFSESSYQSFHRPQSRNSLLSLGSSLRYEKGCLLNKRTRSVSRAQDAMASKLAQYEDLIYKCDWEGCECEFFSDLKELTQHKVNYHHMLALYWCDECRFSFASEEDFNRHDKLFHSFDHMSCIYCSLLLQNKELLQKHLNEHLLHSVPCKYCDKFFLDKKTCDDHVKEYHKGKKKRIKRKPQTILDRIDKDASDDEESFSQNNCKGKQPLTVPTDEKQPIAVNTEEKQFTVRILKQNSVEKTTSLNENVCENSNSCSSSSSSEIPPIDMDRFFKFKAVVELIPLKL